MSLHPSVQQPDTILRYADRAIVTFEVFEPSIGFATTDKAITPPWTTPVPDRHILSTRAPGSLAEHPQYVDRIRRPGTLLKRRLASAPLK